MFALSFPSVVSTWGLHPLAFAALAPLFWVIGRAPWRRVVVYGALYGFGSYALFNYWLAAFHPLALLFVPAIYLCYLALLFPALKLVTDRFPRWAPLWQSVIWVAYEYLKTQGFLGYPYGVIGYSQYLFGPLLRSSALAGVWGVSLIVVLANAWLAQLAGALTLRRGALRRAVELVRQRPAAPAVWALLFAGAVVYGAVLPVDYGATPRWRVALIQQNTDPWRGGYVAYERSLEVLLRQSRRALAEDDPQAVIWSETSFVPGIDWHTRYRQGDRESVRKYELVRRLRAFLDEQPVPFVVGNGDGQKRGGDGERINYNATLLFEGGEIAQTYRKLHLVPFSEHFPDWGPRFIRDLLVRFDTHFWEQGEELTVFDAGVRFSTPICFEDSFGYLNRDFINAGAQVIVNMSNDGWSKSVPAQMQHMAMAVFRAAENRRSVVRAGNSGMTAIIEPSGRITELLAPFVEGRLIGDVPVFDGADTLYTRAGDWLGATLTAGALLLVAAAAGGLLLRRSRRSRGKPLTEDRVAG